MDNRTSITVPSGRPGDADDRRRYRSTVGVLSLAGLANFLLLYYVQPLLPGLASAYAVSPGRSAEVLSVATLGMAASLVLAGPLSDAIGRVPLLRTSLLAAGLMGVASAFAPTWSLLLTMRALEGVALGIVPAVALAYLREEVEPGHHLRANATYIAGTAVGGTLARFAPIPLHDVLGWAGTTLALSGLTVAAGLAVWRWLPASRNFRAHTFDRRRFVDQTRRVLRDPMIMGWCLIGGCGMGVFVGLYNAMAFRVAGDPLPGLSPAIVYLAFPVSIVAPDLARPLAARVGRPRTVLVALGLLAVGIALTLGSNWTMIIIGLGVVTLAFFAVHSLATGGIVAHAQQVGVGVARASSSYFVAYYVGGAVLGAAATWLWSGSGWPAVAGLSLVVVAVAALVAVRLGSQLRLPRVEDEPESVVGAKPSTTRASRPTRAR